MMEPGSLAGAPKWMKMPGTSSCVVEEDEGYYRVSQPNSRCNSGRGQSQVGFMYDCDGYTFCASNRRKANDIFLVYASKNAGSTQSEKGSISFHSDTSPN